MKPGIYDMTPKEYHADPVLKSLGVPSLSSTGIKRLVGKPGSPFRGCPAKFYHHLTNPEPRKDTFDFGSAAHSVVLGKGSSLAIGDFPNWKTKEAQTFKQEAHGAGLVPILASDHQTIMEMDKAVKASAAAMFLKEGIAEQVIIWQADGVWCRAMIDWINPNTEIVVDYKTTSSAHPDDFDRSAFNYSYYVQAAHYCEGLVALGIMEDPAFYFMAQEKEAPYLVTVCGLNRFYFDAGKLVTKEARKILKRCIEKNHWPGYATGIHELNPPGRWAEEQLSIFE